MRQSGNTARRPAPPTASPTKRDAVGKKGQQNERTLTYKISRSKRYKACSDVAGGNNSEPCSRRSCAVADLKIKQPNFEKSHVTRRTRWYFRSTEFRLLNTTIADLPNRYSVKVFVSFGLSFSVPNQKSPGQ